MLGELFAIYLLGNEKEGGRERLRDRDREGDK